MVAVIVSVRRRSDFIFAELFGPVGYEIRYCSSGARFSAVAVVVSLKFEAGFVVELP